MASPGTILSHDSTPTGYGIRQRSNGNLRATSPCCGRTMSGADSKCNGCNFTYVGEQIKLGSPLNKDISPTAMGVHGWVSNVTGYSEVTVSVL